MRCLSCNSLSCFSGLLLSVEHFPQALYSFYNVIIRTTHRNLDPRQSYMHIFHLTSPLCEECTDWLIMHFLLVKRRAYTVAVEKTARNEKLLCWREGEVEVITYACSLFLVLRPYLPLCLILGLPLHFSTSLQNHRVGAACNGRFTKPQPAPWVVPWNIRTMAVWSRYLPTLLPHDDVCLSPRPLSWFMAASRISDHSPISVCSLTALKAFVRKSAAIASMCTYNGFVMPLWAVFCKIDIHVNVLGSEGTSFALHLADRRLVIHPHFHGQLLLSLVQEILRAAPIVLARRVKPRWTYSIAILKTAYGTSSLLSCLQHKKSLRSLATNFVSCEVGIACACKLHGWDLLSTFVPDVKLDTLLSPSNTKKFSCSIVNRSL